MRSLLLIFCFFVFLNFAFTQLSYSPKPLHEDLPFTYVDIDETTPDWAKLLYKENPNIREVNSLFRKWRIENPNVKNGHTRNYKHFLAYLVLEDGINNEGYVELPTDKIERTKAWEKKRNKLQKNNNKSLNGSWSIVGPTFVPQTQGRVNAQSNVYAIDQSKSNPDVLYMGTETGVVFKSIDKGENWVSVSDGSYKHNFI